MDLPETPARLRSLRGGPEDVLPVCRPPYRLVRLYKHLISHRQVTFAKPAKQQQQLIIMQAAFALLASALLVAFVSGAPSHKPNVKELVTGVSKKCVAQTKASADQAKLVFSQAAPKDDTERCYLECVYSGLGVVKDGKFNEQGGKKLVELRFHDAKEKELANKLISTCAKEISAKSGEKCSLGRGIRECFSSHGKQVNFFPTA